MIKYLFTDGTNEVREVETKEELDSLIAASQDPSGVRIWLFSTCEWISYADYKKGSRRQLPVKNNIEKPAEKIKAVPVRRNGWLKRAILITLAGVTVFLVYNFTRIKWEKAQPLQIMASRPANVPMLNADSLLLALESARGTKLDKVTKTNLRIRNTWPERILLQLNTERDTANGNTRFHGIELSIDNTTGYHIDEAIVEVSIWKKEELSRADTFHLSGISYAKAAKRVIENGYKGDSLSVSFQYIRAKSFNFCYAADKESNYGNPADRWFCRE